MWYVYLLRCQDGVIYVGITDDVERRFKEHAAGKGGHYTNYNRPEKILYRESFKNRIQAEQRERQIKRWSKSKKLALIEGNWIQLRELSKSKD